MVSIIIINYKSWQYLNRCLAAIIDIENIEIIAVDNDSNDGIFSTFSSKYPKVKFIESKQNLGFGAACNLGAKNAAGENLLFLNPDTVANEVAIFKMQDFLMQNLEYKIVSCRQHQNLRKHYLLFPNGFRIFGLLRAFEIFFTKKRFQEYKKKSFKFIEPEWVSGSVLMLSKAWFAEIGGWSPEFWMYSEDMDICKKTADKSGKIALLTDVQIFHLHGGATRKNAEISAMAKAEVIKSKHIYYSKHLKGFKKIFAHFILQISSVLFLFPLAILGFLFPFLTKMRVQYLIWNHLLKYYLQAVKKGSWLSEKLINI